MENRQGPPKQVDLTALYENLLLLKNEYGEMNQEQKLADAIGTVKRGAVIGWFGKKPTAPGVNALYGIRANLGKSLDWLFGFSEYRKLDSMASENLNDSGKKLLEGMGFEEKDFQGHAYNGEDYAHIQNIIDDILSSPLFYLAVRAIYSAKCYQSTSSTLTKTMWLSKRLQPWEEVLQGAAGHVDHRNGERYAMLNAKDYLSRLADDIISTIE